MEREPVAIEIDREEYAANAKARRYGNLPTFTAAPPGLSLRRFVVECDGKPTLQGQAVDEAEAVRAYKVCFKDLRQEVEY